MIPPSPTLAAAVAAYEPLLDAAIARAGVSPAVLELCRLRIAHLIGSDPDRTPALAPSAGKGGHPARTGTPVDGPEEGEVLAFAEQFTVDARGVSDADTGPLRTKVGEEGLLALTIALGIIEAQQRLAVVLEEAGA